MRDAPEVLRRAAIYVLQLADRDISPMLGEELLRAIEQDGYTLAARSEAGAEGLREAAQNFMDITDLIDTYFARVNDEFTATGADISDPEREAINAKARDAAEAILRAALAETEPKP